MPLLYPSCRHALHLWSVLQERRHRLGWRSTSDPAEESGGHPTGHHQYQRAVHVVRVPQPSPRHYQEPIWPGEDTRRKFRSESGELDTSDGGLWSGFLLNGRGLSTAPVVLSCSSSLSCVLLRRGGQFIGGCRLSHRGRLRHRWQHSHAGFFQWDIWT